MRTLLYTFGLLWLTTSLTGQEKLYIHKKNGLSLGAWVAATDSIYFDASGSTLYIRVGDQEASYALVDLDSISFGAQSKIVQITYQGNSVQVINPLAFEGVDVEMDGADVTVVATSLDPEVVYQLQGQTTAGSFKLYSESAYTLQLNGVSLVNPDGPAINIQAKQTGSVVVMGGTNNILADGASYADPPLGADGEEEDQDAAFFSEGSLTFSGDGYLEIIGSGSKKHGLATDSQLIIEQGNILVSSAAKDGIHGSDGVAISGGTIEVSAAGDGIDGDNGSVTITGGIITINSTEDDVKGIASDESLTISGGEVFVVVAGNQSKAIKSKDQIQLTGGTIHITLTGDVVLEESGSGYDPSYCTGIKGDEGILLDGATITILGNGIANKGLSSDVDVQMLSGALTVSLSGNGATYKNENNVTDTYSSTGITTDGSIYLYGGDIQISNSGSAGKGISSDEDLVIGDGLADVVLQVTTTGSKILESGTGQNAEYAEAKTIKADRDVVINNGNISLSSNDDGIKAKSSITINGGFLDISKSVEGIEAPFITVNDGEILVNSSDDGFNATMGNGGEANDGSLLLINGGQIAVSASNGDGFDSNGNIQMIGGTVVIHGPQSSPEVGLDFNGNFSISGGLLVVSGTNSNMTEAPGATSAQYSVKATTNSRISAGTLFHVEDSNGIELFTFKPERAYYSMIFSASSIQNGGSLSLYTGGSSTGTEWHGLYTGGSYSGGSLKKTFTITGKLTNVSF